MSRKLCSVRGELAIPRLVSLAPQSPHEFILRTRQGLHEDAKSLTRVEWECAACCFCCHRSPSRSDPLEPAQTLIPSRLGRGTSVALFRIVLGRLDDLLRENQCFPSASETPSDDGDLHPPIATASAVAGRDWQRALRSLWCIDSQAPRTRSLDHSVLDTRTD